MARASSQRDATFCWWSHNFHINSQTCRAKPTAASLNMVLFLKPQRKSSGPSLWRHPFTLMTGLWAGPCSLCRQWARSRSQTHLQAPDLHECTRSPLQRLLDLCSSFLIEEMQYNQVSTAWHWQHATACHFLQRNVSYTVHQYYEGGTIAL